MLDKFIQIIEENNLRPEHIEKIRTQPHPIAQFNFESKNRLSTPDDYCFNERYLLACAVHRINPCRWHDLEVRQSPAVQAFMQRLDLGVIIDEKDFATAKRKDPGTYQQRVEVVAKGRTFRELAAHPKGGGFVKCDGKACGVYREELRNTDEELVRKFSANVSGMFPFDQAEETAHHILALGAVHNAADFMAAVSPE